MRPERQPRAVVTGEDNQRFTIHSGCFQRIENTADAGVKLLDDISINSGRAVAFEIGGARQRNVRERVRKV